MAGIARRLGLAALVAAAMAPACDCVGEVNAPDTAPACFSDLECGVGFVCRDGVCLAGLPTEGEGEAGEGEGEGEGEDAGALVVAPPSISMPETTIGAPVTQTAQLVNIGDATLTLGTIVSDNAAFVVVEPAAGTQIPPGNSRTLTVRFTPTSAGSSSAVVTIPAGASSPTLQVSGNVAAVVVDGAFVARVGPDDAGVGRPDCQCSTKVSPADLDLSWEVVGGATCRRPTSLACGVEDTCTPCNLGPQGEARWRSARTEQARQGELIIVDEEIIHAGDGDDGDFVLRARLLDDCRALLGSLDRAPNETCCAFIDCGADFACYDYEAPVSCVNDCAGFVALARSDDDCMDRGPVLVRARLGIDGVERHFCGTMTRDETVELARVSRRSGAFSITSTATAFTEVAATAACP